MNTIDKIYEEIESMKEKQLTNYIINYYKNNKHSQLTIETLLFIAYDLKKYTIPEDKNVKIEKRRYQYKFRDELIKKYSHCIVTGKSHKICEASHIIPYKENLNKRYDINNGLLLCSELHKMLDEYLISIDADGKLILSNEVLSDAGFANYKEYHLKKLNLNKEVLINLGEHYKKFCEIYKISAKFRINKNC